MLKYIKKLSFGILELIHKLLPVDDRMIVLESNPSYMDNTGALFDEMLKHNLDKKYKLIWLIFDGNFKNEKGSWKEVNIKYSTGKSRLARKFSVLKANYYYSRAKYNFHSHRNYYHFIPKKNQIIVNLTHGTPLKNSTGRHGSQKYVNYIVSTSQFAKELRLKTYDEFNGDFIITGFPRNDKLIKETVKKNIIFWLPTYRQHKSSLNDDQFDTFPLGMNAKKFKFLDSYLIENNYKMIIKPHPAQKLDIHDGLKNIEFISDSSLVHNDEHLYEILSKTEILITDYSSVFLDFLLLDRPIIFTFDDLDSYSIDPGFMIDNIKEYAPGEQIYSFDEFINVLDKIIQNKNDEYQIERKEVNAIFNRFNDQKNSERVLKEVGIL